MISIEKWCCTVDADTITSVVGQMRSETDALVLPPWYKLVRWPAGLPLCRL